MTPAPAHRRTRRPASRRRLARRPSARLRAAWSGGAGLLVALAVLAPTYVWLVGRAGGLAAVGAWVEAVGGPGASPGGGLTVPEERVPTVGWGPGVVLVAVLAVGAQVWRAWAGTP